MYNVSIIVNGMRFDAVNEEDFCSCKGCDIGKGYTTAGCLFSELCKRRNIIFKKSTKSFER